MKENKCKRCLNDVELEMVAGGADPIEPKPSGAPHGMCSYRYNPGLDACPYTEAEKLLYVDVNECIGCKYCGNPASIE